MQMPMNYDAFHYKGHLEAWRFQLLRFCCFKKKGKKAWCKVDKWCGAKERSSLSFPLLLQHQTPENRSFKNVLVQRWVIPAARLGQVETGPGGAGQQQVNWSLGKHLCLLFKKFLVKDSCSKGARKAWCSDKPWKDISELLFQKQAGSGSLHMVPLQYHPRFLFITWGGFC